jgi:circadian clock protein KaiC
VQRHGVKRVFIDGVDGLTNIAAETARVPHALTALANELRVLGVTSVWTGQVDLGGSDPSRPLSNLALQGLSSITENAILMRHVEVRSRLHRMVSVLKARLSNIEQDLRCFTITSRGIVVERDGGTARSVLAETPSPSPASGT